MKFSSLNWKDIENYLKDDDRCVFPIGCTEQHAYLSLSTDSILAEKLSQEAAEPLNIPVLPVLHYGHTPLFMSYPGTISLKMDTLWTVVKDILDSLSHHGFRRIIIVNGHGGNMPLAEFVNEWNQSHSDVRIKFHNWWCAPAALSKVNEIDPVASHASWMENFEWTRLKNVKQPSDKKEMVDKEKLKRSSPEEARQLLGDGNFGGYYERSDKEMALIWKTAVAETRELITGEW